MATPSDAGSKPVGVGIEVSELESAVSDGEDVAVSLGEAYVVSRQIAREKERLVSPLDVAMLIDQPDEGAVGVDERRKPTRVWAMGGGVEMPRGSVLWETLMRPVVVVLSLEAVESLLLGSKGFRGWSGCRRFQSFVKALVRSVLRGASWCDVLRPDAESDPPEGEGAESAQGIWLRKRDSVISSKNQRQPILPEKSHEDRSEEHTSELQSQ